MKTENYGLMHVETCLCVWEYLLELRGIKTDAETELGLKTPTCLLEDFIANQGTATTRVELIQSTLIEQLEKQWRAHHEDNELYCFDWEFVPAFIGYFIELTKLEYGFDCSDDVSDKIIKHVLANFNKAEDSKIIDRTT